MEAATSMCSGLPVGSINICTAECRTCLLALVNAVLGWRVLPSSWADIPIAPIPKPGKDLGRIDGCRPISLLDIVLKSFDKMLHTHAKKHFLPYQYGGTFGSEETAWMVIKALESR